MSCGDIALISAIVAISGGFDSYAFVFYYPAIIAYSLVFSLRTTAYFTGAVLVLYTFVVLVVSGEAFSGDPQETAATMAARPHDICRRHDGEQHVPFRRATRTQEEVSRVASRPRRRSARVTANSTNA